MRLIAIALLLAGCAELPVCPPAQAAILHTVDGRVFLGFDAESMAAWIEGIKREARGECAFRKKGAES